MFSVQFLLNEVSWTFNARAGCPFNGTGSGKTLKVDKKMVIGEFIQSGVDRRICNRGRGHTNTFYEKQ